MKTLTLILLIQGAALANDYMYTAGRQSTMDHFIPANLMALLDQNSNIEWPDQEYNDFMHKLGCRSTPKSIVCMDHGKAITYGFEPKEAEPEPVIMVIQDGAARGF